MACDRINISSGWKFFFGEGMGFPPPPPHPLVITFPMKVRCRRNRFPRVVPHSVIVQWKKKHFQEFGRVKTNKKNHRKVNIAFICGVNRWNEWVSVCQWLICSCLKRVAESVHWSVHCLMFISSNATHGTTNCAGCSHLNTTKWSC